MNNVRIFSGLAMLVVSIGCGRPVIETANLHQECEPGEGECAEGQVCGLSNSVEGQITSCEIVCDGDFDCPEGTRCNLPPILPDSLLNTCVDSEG